MVSSGMVSKTVSLPMKKVEKRSSDVSKFKVKSSLLCKTSSVSGLRPSSIFGNDQIIAHDKHLQNLNNIKAIDKEATNLKNRSYEVVCVISACTAMYEVRYPAHEASRRIEASSIHKTTLSNLRSLDADYYYGISSAELSFSRMLCDHVKALKGYVKDTTADAIISEASANANLICEALKNIVREAEEHIQRSSDLIWFVQHRMRYPNDENTKRIGFNTEYSKDIASLRGPQGDFYFGFHTGLLQLAQLFKKLASFSTEASDVPFLESDDEERDVEQTACPLLSHYREKIEASKMAFPNFYASEFPVLD